MGKDERGYIVVETIGSFLLFVLLVLSILSLINIVAVQARIHYALTQAAQTISMYSYTLDVIGVADAVANNAAQAERVEQESDEFKENLSQLLDGLESLDIAEIGSSGEALADQTGGWASDIASDPESSIQALLNYALRESGNAVFGDLVRPLVGHYLSNGSMSGEEYLQAAHIIGGLEGLEFGGVGLLDPDEMEGDDSTLLTSDRDVKIVVQYDIDYSFGALMLPFGEPKLHVTQEVRTKAWLGGKGEGYTP